MASINRKIANTNRTHEGAVAETVNVELQLRRSVLSCFLWEDTFYEDGVSIADRIRTVAAQNKPEVVAALAIEARDNGLRHVPLLLLLDLIRRGGKGVADTIFNVIRRPDELTELVSLYWLYNPGKGLSAQLKKGLARAFLKFDEYQLAKYNRDGAVKLRDVLFLAHVKPQTPEQEALFKRLVDGELSTPDTWEVNLSAGADKKETFERLISEGKMGYLALLRNLRNMVQSGVSNKVVSDAIIARKGSRYVLPFRYIAAAKAAPQFEGAIETAFLASMAESEKLKGHTVVVIDVSGSMQGMLSGKSDMRREDAANALAMIVRELSDTVSVYATGDRTVYVPSRRGFALADAIKTADAGYGGIYLKQAMDFVAANEKGPIDRVIVFTDEQDCGHGKNGPQYAVTPGKRNYLINVASYQNGIGFGKWTKIDGFSESVVKFIIESERVAGDEVTS